MELSAPNRLKETITDMKLGKVMAEVPVDIGGQESASALTLASAKRLDCQAVDGE